eukprot:scaffold5717_cov112-Isochrysis_galbana.AAC.2
MRSAPRRVLQCAWRCSKRAERHGKHLAHKKKLHRSTRIVESRGSRLAGCWAQDWGGRQCLQPEAAPRPFVQLNVESVELAQQAEAALAQPLLPMGACGTCRRHRTHPLCKPPPARPDRADTVRLPLTRPARRPPHPTGCPPLGRVAQPTGREGLAGFVHVQIDVARSAPPAKGGAEPPRALRVELVQGNRRGEGAEHRLRLLRVSPIDGAERKEEDVRAEKEPCQVIVDGGRAHQRRLDGRLKPGARSVEQGPETGVGRGGVHPLQLRLEPLHRVAQHRDVCEARAQG